MSTKASKEETAPSSGVRFGRRLLEQRELSIFLVVLLVAIFLNFASPNFLKPANLNALVLGLSFNAIVAVGMTVLLISGGFDLSVGATLALAGAAAGFAMTKLDVSAPVAILFGLGTGAFVGLLNGLIIAKVGVNALIGSPPPSEM
jgi:ribose transport system permease protein